MTTSLHKPTRQLDRLFLVDAKKRLINNTPYDVYRLANLFPHDRVEVIDLRFPMRDGLPESDTVVLFLETAGTWMCFDWDPARFIQRLDQLCSRYRRCTVVGPQARALRELTGYSFEVIDTLDFINAVEPDARGATPLAMALLDGERHRGYNGEYFDGERLRLAPTFSISYSMNCPLRCGFCYYGDATQIPKPTFAETLRDIEAIWRHGHHHFYFMDPNLLLSPSQLDALRQFHLRSDRRFTYYCQVSPNYLSETRLSQLAASGCCGMVVGIENVDCILDKGSIEQARDRVAQVRAFGMMPMLFFMIDEEHDIEDLVAEFDPIPFRYTLLNRAFASDRSLRAIDAGFAQKRRLAARHADVIRRLEARPNFLGNLSHQRNALASKDFH